MKNCHIVSPLRMYGDFSEQKPEARIQKPEARRQKKAGILNFLLLSS